MFKAYPSDRVQAEKAVLVHVSLRAYSLQAIEGTYDRLDTLDVFQLKRILWLVKAGIASISALHEYSPAVTAT